MQDLKATVASLATMMAALIAKVIKKEEDIDSGANMSVVSDLSHLDSNTPFCWAEEPGGVEMADKSFTEGTGYQQPVQNGVCEDIGRAVGATDRATAVHTTRASFHR